MTPVDLFVYGTLRSGHPEHEALCRGVVEVQAASVWGRLQHLPEGYPALELPAGVVLEVGTLDYEADASKLAGTVSPIGGQPCPADGWTQVVGELLTFPDAATMLPVLDEYEEFTPGQPSLYTRVLAAVQVLDKSQLAWLYVRGDS